MCRDLPYALPEGSFVNTLAIALPPLLFSYLTSRKRIDQVTGGLPTSKGRGVSGYQAAIYLLIEFWREDALDNGLYQFHWVN